MSFIYSGSLTQTKFLLNNLACTEKRAKLSTSFESLFSGSKSVNVSNAVSQSLPQAQRQTDRLLGKGNGNHRGEFMWAERRTNSCSTRMVYCANQTGLESKGLKEFDAVQITHINSTSYWEVPADRRLAHSKRKKKSVEELVKPDPGCIICVAAQCGAAGAG